MILLQDPVVTGKPMSEPLVAQLIFLAVVALFVLYIWRRVKRNRP